MKEIYVSNRRHNSNKLLVVLIHYITEENLLVVELDRGVEVGDLGTPYLALFAGLGLAE